MSAKLRYHAAPATLVLLAVVLALTVLGLLTLSGAEAANTQPNCGETITADTTLDSDLVDCPNHGIVIGADDITLDLNGHPIDGDGTPAAGCNPRKEFCDIGVFNGGHDGVTMRDGSVREFDAGVFVFKARATRVLDISSKKNTSFGLFFNELSHSLIRDSSGSNNIPPEGDGMGVFGSHDLRIVDNTFRNNPGPGIHVEDSNDNLIKGNLFSHSSPGVLIGRPIGDRNEVRDNRFVRNDVAASSSAAAETCSPATTSPETVGIGIEEGSHNLVARNVVVEPRTERHQARTRLSRRVRSAGSTTSSAATWSNAAAAMGSWSTRRAPAVLRRNVAMGAEGDGFDVESRSTKLTKNRARRNADLGIDAVKGVIDGGGNRASGNGDQRQCGT